MLHQFSQNRLSLKAKILIFSLGLISSQAFSKTPGALETLEELVTLHKKQYSTLYKQVQENTKLITNFDEIHDVRLDPYFVKSLLFHSGEKYLSLNKTSEDQCFFYSLIENNLLKTANGEIRNVIIHYKNKDKKSETALISKDNFFQLLYSKECFNNKEISTLFNKKNVTSTITNTKFFVPQTEQECKSVLNDWQTNPYTPYICNVSEIIRKGTLASSKLATIKSTDFRKRRHYQSQIKNKEFFAQSIPLFQRSYISNLCTNINNSEKFCSDYLAKDVWTKIINGERPKYLMSYKCKNMMGKKDVSIKDLRSCSAKFKKEPDYCVLNGNKRLSSLFPLQNCNTLSDAFNESRLKTNYHDCPGRIDNQGITNLHRIINHISDQKSESTPDTCEFQANYSFAKLNIDYENQKAWPMKICYKNKVTEDDICEIYIPGSSETSELSENKVVAKILYKSYGASDKEVCRIVDDKSYNPVRLEYRVGCFIVYNRAECSTLHCPKKVILNKKEINNLNYVGVPTFDYFPNSFSNEKYSAVNILADTYKIEKRSIKNLTELHFYFKQFKKGIVHGIGCAEDLLPVYFKRKSLNSCLPLPFIIDGIVEKNNEKFLIFRSSIEDVHTPRLMKWNYIFSSIASYRELHPLSTWALYGIKK
jgi:hypothetical protein